MKKQLYFYHVVPLEQLGAFDNKSILTADPVFSDEEFKPAYLYLQQTLGFYPLFFAVGEANEAIDNDGGAVRVTGYQNQWRRWLGGEHVDGVYRKRYRQAGEAPNLVLFALPVESLVGQLDTAFTDYTWWNIALGDLLNGRPVERQCERILYKRSWANHRWLARARKDGHDVQFLSNRLDFSKVEFVWTRNRKTACVMREKDFERVEVKRLLLEAD